MNGVVKFVGMAAVVSACVSAAQAVEIQTVTVGNPGNADDTEGDGYGCVDYVYQIGKFEVTAGQYTEFLNAVADEDAYGLYNEEMWTHEEGCKIERTGSSGAYAYSVAADRSDRPANYISWGDAARFANWLHNGQPTGAQDLTTTEDGSYYLNGVTTDGELIDIEREEDATWVIPSEDEWYKAAYYDGGSGVYYDYPTSSDSVPSNVLGNPTDPGNNATFYDSGDYTIGSPYWRTEVGAHENSDSPYGTFDQAGNIWEWNEAVISSGRGLRGGSFNDDDYYLHTAGRNHNNPTSDRYALGFRVAEVSAECGNDVVEFGEECDDGNTDDGDGCSSTCHIEPPVPAVSEWGVAVMAILVLAAGTIVLRRHRRAA